MPNLRQVWAGFIACLLMGVNPVQAANSLHASPAQLPAEEIVPEPEFFGLVSPYPSAETQAPIPIPKLPELDLPEEQADVWAELRNGFAMPDLETEDVRKHEQALLKNPNSLVSMLRRSEPYMYFIAQECARR
ncbi:MAG TPA: hypothetical protein VFV28_05905, partial [Limnobacter sp.]|nr:hypothetical protein [Limnobacter sp.]